MWITEIIKIVTRLKLFVHDPQQRLVTIWEGGVKSSYQQRPVLFSPRALTSPQGSHRNQPESIRVPRLVRDRFSDFPLARGSWNF